MSYHIFIVRPWKNGTYGVWERAENWKEFEPLEVYKNALEARKAADSALDKYDREN
jgi:hypothetical protein